MTGSLCPDQIAQQEFEPVHAIQKDHVHRPSQQLPHIFGRKEMSDGIWKKNVRLRLPVAVTSSWN